MVANKPAEKAKKEEKKDTRDTKPRVIKTDKSKQTGNRPKNAN